MSKLREPYTITFVKWLLILSLPFQFIIIQNDDFKNSYFITLYINNFKHLSELRKSFFSIFSFSVGDLIYLLVLIGSITYFFKNRFFYLNYKFYFLKDVFLFLSVVHVFFQISWGLNYHSESLESKLNIDTQYSDEELEKVVLYLIRKTNDLHSELSINDSTPVKFPFNKKQARILLTNKKNDIVKNSMLSSLISYMGYAGYLNPFTLEAQVNEKIPMISYLTTIVHEQSHQNGIARENESNYWAYKITSNNKNKYIQYAGYSFALRYCLNDLYGKNKERSKLLSKNIHLGVKKNFKSINTFWEKYQNPFEPIFKKFYDRFLKINNQKLGVLSYNEMVSLVIFDLKNAIQQKKLLL